MRVGVAVPATPETTGGGYTYERDVLGGLLEEAGARHELVLLGPTLQRPEGTPRDCAYLALCPPPPPPSGLLARVARRLRGRRGGNGAVVAPLPEEEDDASRIARLLRGGGVQFIVHLNPYYIPTQELPYLTVIWDLEYLRQPYFPEVSGSGEWQRRERHFWSSLRRATWVVTGTGVGKADIETCFGIQGDRIAVVPLPTPSDALGHSPDPGSALARYGLTEDFLLYPAQFWPHKNHVTLLKALRLLRDRYDMRPLLVLAGADQGNRAHIEARAREWGVAEQVRLLGFIPRRDLLNLYTRARMLVNASAFGPDNIPPLEAFALGCPVAYGRVRGAEEQLGDSALLVNVLDTGAWAEAIRSLWTDRALRDRLVARGRLRAAQWTGRQVAAALLDLIDRFAAVRELWAE